MNVSKIKSFFLDNKKSLFYAVFFLFSFFLFSDLAFASQTNWGAWETDAINKGIKVINYILIMSSALLWAATALISLFLTPGWVNGSIFGLDGYMKEMWIMVSNIVYFIFAFILIMIAFMNIIGKWDKWELKSALPKFIVWVVMVPFTWFFVQFVLSISAILTVWVLTLPYDTFESKNTYREAIAEMQKIITNPNAKNTEWKQVDEWIPTTFVLNLSQNLLSKGEDDKTTFIKKDEFLSQWKDRKISEILQWDEESDHENSIFGVLGLYTYGIMQIQYLDTENGWMFWEAVGDITDLTLKLIFDALFVIVYLVLMIALFLALLVRGIKLWVYAMFSPTFGLLYFFDKADGVGEWNGKFGIKDFISLALVPVYVAAALSFGLLFIMVSSYGMWDSNLMTTCTAEQIDDASKIPPEKMNCMNIGGFTFAIHWGVWESTSWSQSGWALWRIIMQLFGIVVLWLAVMTALKQSEITNKITEPIQQLGWNVWSLIAKSPTYAPIIPGLPSVQWLSKISTMPDQAIQTRIANNVSPYQDNINTLFGTKTISASDEARFTNILKNGIESESELNEVRSMYKWWVAEFGRNNAKLQQLEQKMLIPLSNSGILKSQGIQVSREEVDDKFFMAMVWKIDTIEAWRLRDAKNPWDISKDDVKDNSKVVAWDLRQEKLSHTDMDAIEGVSVGSSKRIKFVADTSWENGVGDIYIKAKNGSEINKFDINLQSMDASSTLATGDELKELKKLYEAIWEDDWDFKRILSQLWFTKESDILSSVKKKD